MASSSRLAASSDSVERQAQARKPRNKIYPVCVCPVQAQLRVRVLAALCLKAFRTVDAGMTGDDATCFGSGGGVGMQLRLPGVDPPQQVQAAPERLEPAFWVRRICVVDELKAGAEHVVRNIELRRGFNIIWAPTRR